MSEFSFARLCALIGLSILLTACQQPNAGVAKSLASPQAVGKLAENRWLTPTNQVLTPAGRQVDLPGIKPQALALSPDGMMLVTTGWSKDLLVLDPVSGQVRQRLILADATRAAVKADETNLTATTVPKLSLTGLRFSPDGRWLYLSNVNGSIVVFAVDAAARTLTETHNWRLPAVTTSTRKTEIPAGLAVSADGSRLYVVGCLGDRLLELETVTGRLVRQWPVGVAPFDVVLVAGKAYVSNQGGRQLDADALAGPAGRGTKVRIDARGIASEGSVTILSLGAEPAAKELIVGLHPSALAVSPDARYVVVANSGSDTLSVIDTRTDAVVEKIWARQKPSDLFGAQPCALAFDRSGENLLVCNATQNAVAVVEFEPTRNASRVTGLIPVGWFPASLAYDAARRAVYVANLKGIGLAKEFAAGEPVIYTTRDFWGTLSLVPVPTGRALAAATATALANMCYPKLAEAALPPRRGQPPRPVPERTGEPSVFKHVIYVIKENRSYDQILGDMPEGNGDATLCTFGEKFTPNQHKLAREFVLLDNTYCSGMASSDGHQWTDSGIVNDYLERQVASTFPRSYPNAKSSEAADALNYASSGFIWDHALAHGKTFRNYGEWMASDSGWADPARKGKPHWRDFWNDYVNGTRLMRLASKPAIAGLREHSKLDTVGWDVNVPDVLRADAFIAELKQFEAKGGFPNLIILFLPNDHTAATRPNVPVPGAFLADNDLAFGRIVEAVSRSKFWAETCIIAIEDDPQNGWDHVSGYRTTCYVASPYTKRRQTISTPYNQTSIMRTIELILGLPPLHQLDATATPMFDCFTMTPDFTPFTYVPNQVPLDELNPDPKKIAHAGQRAHALASAKLPLDVPDRCDEGELNRILWHAMKGHEKPFPEWATKPAEDRD